MAIDFKLPHLGENIDSGQIVNILVAKGDTVEKDQMVLELETDKASIDVPTNVSGTVVKVHVNEGDDAKAGQVIFTIDESGAGATSPAAEAEPPAEAAPEPEPAKAEAPEPKAPEPPAPSPAAEPPMPAASSIIPASAAHVPAAPSVRRFSREIGIDITKVTGSGPGGRVSIEDVKAYAKKLNTERPSGGGGTISVEQRPLPDFSQWGEVNTTPMSNVRRTTAVHLSHAWSTIPHVTQFDKADITDLEAYRKKFGKRAEAAGGKLTVTAILLKVLASALKKFPQFNASVDMANQTIVYKDYCNIGIAVDTDRGLIVPVIRDVDQKNIIELTVELAGISERARNKKTSIEEMQGGTFTLSNLGGIGGVGFTPIVNWPEVAILGVARASTEAVHQDGTFVPRLMMPMSLSYDHRIIDGADGARFMRWIVEALEHPILMALEG